MPAVTIGTVSTHTGFLEHRFHGNLYKFNKSVNFQKLTISSNGTSLSNGRAIIVQLSDVQGRTGSVFDMRSYALVTSLESKIVTSGQNTFTFPTNSLTPGVTYAIGVSFDAEQSSAGIGMTGTYNHTSTHVINSDFSLVAENIGGAMLNHVTNYYYHGGGSPSLHSWGDSTFYQIIEYADAPIRTFTYPSIPSDLRAGDIINFNATGAIVDISGLKLVSAKVAMYGAMGGSARENSPGGYGGYSEAVVDFRNRSAFIAIGMAPGNSATGGFNGGGSSYDTGGGGGGATDLRLGGQLLSNRVLVAGGGGGGGYENAGYTSGGGHGGGANRPGINGNKGFGEGGQLNRGGNNVGTFGIGGSYSSPGASYGNQNGNGGGGGGWYGGGMAQSNNEDYAGGGGSGYADTTVCKNIVGMDGGVYSSQSGGTSWSSHGKITITILAIGGFIDEAIPIGSLDTYKKETIDSLRTHVNKLRTNFTLPEVQWGEPIIVKNVTPIRADHWNEIESSIDSVYKTTGVPYINDSIRAQFSEPIIANNKLHPLTSLERRIENIARSLRNK